MSADLRAAAQRVLDWLDAPGDGALSDSDLEALRTALAAAPEQAEPVGEVYRAHPGARLRGIGIDAARLYEGANVKPGDKLYTAAPAPAPVVQPLTDEAIVLHGLMMCSSSEHDYTQWFIDGVRFAERAHGIGAQEQPCHKRRDDPCKCSRNAMLCDGIGAQEQP